MRPASIAVVGASPNPSIGLNMLLSLQRMGFPGTVMPVNPRHATIAGHTCYASVADLPISPDVVALCVSSSQAEPMLRQAAEKGARAAVIYDAGFAERGAEGASLQASIVGLCREAGIALCGPNCMGVLSPIERSSSWIQELRDPSRLVGDIGIVSQSGAICISMLLDVRRFGYSHMVSSGNEAGITMCDYVAFLIDDSSTRAIGLFVEAVREPERFVALLDRARDAGKPLVVLKVGRTARTKHAILSHTGGMTGESRVFSEVLRAHRAIEVNDLVEFTETLAACRAARPLEGRRIGAVTSSGGLAELILDVGDSQGNDLPPLAPAARAKLVETLGSITGDGNPLDAWGNGDFRRNLAAGLEMLDESPDHDVIALCRDAFDDKPFDDPEREREYVRILAASAKKSDKPHFLLHTRPGLMDGPILEICAQAGVAVLGGLAQGLRAIDRLAWQREGMPKQRPRIVPAAGGLAPLLAKGPRVTVNERDAKKLLAAQGVLVPAEVAVGTLDAARAAAKEVGYPVVLKVAADEIAHKSEHGLVAVGVVDEAALEVAWKRMVSTLETSFPRVTASFVVQQQVPRGIEIFAGVKNDADFGLVFAVGFGGVLVEITKDFAVRPLPLREGDVEAMLAELRGAPVLQGVRGQAPADVEALTASLYALADYAWADADQIAEIDVNPIIVLERGRGCYAVDGLIVPRQVGTATS